MPERKFTDAELIDALAACDGNDSAAARMLGVSRGAIQQRKRNLPPELRGDPKGIVPNDAVCLWIRVCLDRMIGTAGHPADVLDAQRGLLERLAAVVASEAATIGGQRRENHAKTALDKDTAHFITLGGDD